MLTIEPIPALSDNYAYAIFAPDKKRAIVVDPSEAAPVRSVLAREGAALHAIWCTHHHHDHVGGIAELRHEHRDVRVFASAHDADAKRIPHQTDSLVDGDLLDAFDRPVRVLSIPGHTLGAVAYAVDGAVFTGDTLFLAGCGRVFEGTMPMMRASLEKLSALPDETRVYCGHEYTEANLRFAVAVEGEGGAALTKARSRTANQRARMEPTVPGTIAVERATNVFLRTREPTVRAAAERLAGAPCTTQDDVFAALRRAKDSFR